MLTADEIRDAAKKRVEYIVSKERALGNLTKVAEGKLYDTLMDEFTRRLSGKDGKLIGANNVSVINAINTIVDNFMANEQMVVMNSYISGLGAINGLNADYYNKLSGDKAKAYTKDANTYMASVIGIGSGNKLVRGGFLDSFVKDTTIKNELKQFVYGAVTGGTSFKDFTSQLRERVISSGDGSGVLQRHYKTFAYDTMSQYDRAIGLQYKEKLGLKYGLYSGGLIDDSREFCIKRNNKVFTDEEMGKWVDDPTLPRSVKERKSGVVSGYNAAIDLGRWNCRHTINWISKEMALHLRPELSKHNN